MKESEVRAAWEGTFEAKVSEVRLEWFRLFSHLPFAPLQGWAAARIAREVAWREKQVADWIYASKHGAGALMSHALGQKDPGPPYVHTFGLPEYACFVLVTAGAEQDGTFMHDLGVFELQVYASKDGNHIDPETVHWERPEPMPGFEDAPPGFAWFRFAARSSDAA